MASSLVLLACVALCVEISTALPSARTSDKVLYCYFGSWATYRSGEGAYNVADMDPTMCTHMVYTFAGFNTDGTIRSLDPYNDLPDNWGKGNYQKFNALVQRNPGLKTLLAIGGWNLGSTPFSTAAATAESRARFADSAVIFLRQYGFHGLDVDWEYPTQRGGSPQDKANFVLLLQALADRLRPEGMLLTVAVGAMETVVDAAYDVPAMSKIVDLIVLMSFDYHTAAGQYVTGINAPLKAPASAPGDKLNIESSVSYWLKVGAPSNKLVVGLAMYGRTFTLADPNQHGIGAPTVGAGQEGAYTHEPGYLGYYEICEAQAQQGQWTQVYDAETASLYAYHGNQWVSYDDSRTLASKVNYIVSQGLAGAMVWPIETDDFHGHCNAGVNPLQTAIKKGLGL